MAMCNRMTQFIITCEHGGHRIPHQYQSYFYGFELLLQSHRGYDRGALTMAKGLATRLNALLFVAVTSRLLIDLNRSIGHPHLFSEVTTSLPLNIRQAIVARYYEPYRKRVERAIIEAIDCGNNVIHIASHSFTAVFKGQERLADVGLLYDPSRLGEHQLCCYWQSKLKECLPELTIRRNYPYLGKADGFTSYLRRQFPADRYLGIELEINQKHVVRGRKYWQQLRQRLINAMGMLP